MINIELVIISYILISFLLFYYYSENANIEGACTSKPFYYNKKTTPDSKDFIASPGEEYKTASTQNMISAFVSKMDEIEASMVDIKKKIPVKFNLGVVNNTDGSPHMYVEGTLPNVSLSFLIIHGLNCIVYNPSTVKTRCALLPASANFIVSR